MKVISGSLKGRNIKGYDIDGTRPTMDRVKESVFGMIQSYVPESVVLDLFSGTGNYGIEAISNGARMVYFNDHNKKCVRQIKNNLVEFNVLDKGILTTMDYYEALNYFQKQQVKFDLVFLDPPYKEAITNKIMDVLVKNNMLKNNALIICEVIKKEIYLNNQLILFKERQYGEKIVLIYKYKDV